MDPKTGEEKAVTISADDGFRPNASLGDLARLRAVFKKDGSTTAGNSSQVSDGAAAVLLMKRSEARKRGFPILGVFRFFFLKSIECSGNQLFKFLRCHPGVLLLLELTQQLWVLAQRWQFQKL